MIKFPKGTSKDFKEGTKFGLSIWKEREKHLLKVIQVWKDRYGYIRNKKT